MLVGLLGKKLGMTQVYDEDGSAIPVTLIQAGPCQILQKKEKARVFVRSVGVQKSISIKDSVYGVAENV